MATIRELLNCSQPLLAGDSAKLDAELLLAFCLGRSRSYLYAWPEQSVDANCEKKFLELIARRIAGEPIAYLIGTREFWSLPLAVNNSTLIPRPETERLVEVALQLLTTSAARVLDLGTGTGAIALALAKEKSTWQVTGVDIAADAVALAQGNARQLEIDNASFLQSDWFAALDHQQFDLIVSNPPYITADDPHLQSGDVRFEPRRALVADQHGLGAIAAIIAAAKDFLMRDGWLLFEHGFEQAPAVRTLLMEGGFSDISTWNDYGGRERISGGRRA